jgi:uncharacterized membrane protein
MLFAVVSVFDFCLIILYNTHRFSHFVFMNTADYYRAVLLGVVIGMVFLTGIYVFISPVENVEALEPKSNFEVVDTYKDRCDVVRYTDGSMATYKYFLHCENK